MANTSSQRSLAVGDHVRLKNRAASEHLSYQVESEQVASMREPIDGLILSLRDISTGQLVTQTDGDLDGYVVELLFDNTFSPRYASLRNAPRTAERPEATPAWRRMHAVLRDLAGKGEMLATSSPNFATDSPLAKMLDGWKVIKVRSLDITSLESAGAPTA